MILIVASKFDKSDAHVIDKMIERAIETLKIAGESYKVVRVPGANEIPVTIKHLVHKQEDKYTAIIALGCVIKGDTDHYELVIKSVTEGLTQLSLELEMPIIQGILACQNKKQAETRIYLGAEYAETALEMKKLFEA